MTRRHAFAHALATAAVVLAIPTSALPDTDTQSAMPLAGATLPAETIRESRFRFLDLNGDDYLTRNEIGKDNPILRSQFSSLDANHDGRLSESEYVLNGQPKHSTVQ